MHDGSALKFTTIYCVACVTNSETVKIWNTNMCLLRYVYDVWAQSRLFGENLCQVVESTSQKKALALLL